MITDRIKAEEGYDAIVKRINEDYSSGKINAVIIGDMSVTERKPLIKYCYGNSIRFYLLPKIGDVILSGAEELHVFDSPILLTREYSLTVEQRVIKRTIDIVFSLLLIILHFINYRKIILKETTFPYIQTSSYQKIVH